MEQVKIFLKGVLVIVAFFAIAISAINTIASSPYGVIKACGVIAVLVDFFVVYKIFKKGLE